MIMSQWQSHGCCGDRQEDPLLALSLQHHHIRPSLLRTRGGALRRDLRLGCKDLNYTCYERWQLSFWQAGNGGG